MVTYQDLATQVLQRTDLEHSEFVSNEEMLSMLNSSAAELHELLAFKFSEDYWVSEQSYDTSTSSTSSLDLPSDFFKLIAFDQLMGDGYVSVGRYTLSTRDRYSEDVDVGTYRLTYIPRYENATSLSDTLPDNYVLQNWYDYIVVDVSIKVLTKEESDASVLMMQKQSLLDRINRASGQRDAGEPICLAYLQRPELYELPRLRDKSPSVRYRLAGNKIKLVKQGNLWQ